MLNSDIYLVIAIIAFILVIMSAVIMMVSRYKRCPSDMILVVTGRTGNGEPFRCIHGGGVLIWPMIQDYRFISLAPYTVPVSIQNVPTKNGECVDLTGSFTVGVSTRPDLMKIAAERLLSLTGHEIESLAEEIYLTHLRKAIASMNIERITQDISGMLEEIRRNVDPELNKIGLYLINVNITDIFEASE